MSLKSVYTGSCVLSVDTVNGHEIRAVTMFKHSYGRGLFWFWPQLVVVASNVSPVFPSAVIIFLISSVCHISDMINIASSMNSFSILADIHLHIPWNHNLSWTVTPHVWYWHNVFFAPVITTCPLPAVMLLLSSGSRTAFWLQFSNYADHENALCWKLGEKWWRTRLRPVSSCTFEYVVCFMNVKEKALGITS